MGVQLSLTDQGWEINDLPGWDAWSFVVSLDRRCVTVIAPPGQMVTAPMWRRMPIGTALRFVTDARQQDIFKALAVAEDAATQRRPYGGSNEHTWAVVAAYRDALACDLTPVPALAARFKTSERTAERWIADARRAGHLADYWTEKREAAQR